MRIIPTTWWGFRTSELPKSYGNTFNATNHYYISLSLLASVEIILIDIKYWLFKYIWFFGKKLDEYSYQKKWSILQSDCYGFIMHRYEKKRMFRISTVHAASRMASKALTAYRPYMEFGSGSLSVSSYDTVCPLISNCAFLYPRSFVISLCCHSIYHLQR